MRTMPRIIQAACAAALLLAMGGEALAQTSPSSVGRYTAQRKPRVTVLEFTDTNSQAQDQKYGNSVQAMLVTFLKRKSQFVVVERQKLGDVFAEWQRNQQGITNLQTDDPAAQELLERIDAIILGNVTLLDVSAEPRKSASGEEERIQGRKIEIDAKLLSRADGRIIAAAQRSGPVNCLRSIVERLGVTLEQEFLRPYYGKLKINLTEPTNVRIFLTPILLDTALDEEKPPVERGSTVRIASLQDKVEPWMTDPTTYTIETLLSGWYSMRLERPGYEQLGTEYSVWEARDLFGDIQVYEKASNQPLRHTKKDQQRFVVHVDPLSTNVIEGDRLGLEFRMKTGSVAARVKRQFLDDDYTHTPERIVLIGDEGLEINTYEALQEYTEDETCDLFDEKDPKVRDLGKTYVAAKQPFDIDKFKGGKLIFEDYQGEPIPAGEYEMYLWEPYYELLSTSVGIRHLDKAKVQGSVLSRNMLPLELTATGAKTPHKLVLAGEKTHHRVEVPIDFSRVRLTTDLPVDVYTASTSIPGLSAWTSSAELLPKSLMPPTYDAKIDDDNKARKVAAEKEKKKRDREKRRTGDDDDEESEEEIQYPLPLKMAFEESAETAARRVSLQIKTRMAIGGRLDALRSLPDLLSDDIYVDHTLTEILNTLLDREIEEEDKGPGVGDVLKGVAVIAGSALLEATTGVAVPPRAVVVQAPSAPQPATPEGAVPPATSVPDALPAEPAEPVEPPLPRDPDELRALLAKRLEALDLLILDDEDMAQLQRFPDIGLILDRYVKAGGAAFAFISEPGTYELVLGAPLAVEAKDKPTSRFNVAPGEVSGLQLAVNKKKVEVKGKRVVPEVRRFDQGGLWRVLAFTQGRKSPRILEKGHRDQGGYVAVWLDSPETFRGRRGGTVPEVEEIREKVEKHVFDWARFLMYRRFDKAGDARTRAEQAIAR